MDWLIIAIIVPLSLAFAICGIQLRRGKWLMLMAGYNTMPKAERAKVNGKALGKFLGSVFILLSFLTLILAFFPNTTVIYFYLVATVVLSVASLVYVNKSNKFIQNN